MQKILTSFALGLGISMGVIVGIVGSAIIIEGIGLFDSEYDSRYVHGVVTKSEEDVMLDLSITDEDRMTLLLGSWSGIAYNEGDLGPYEFHWHATELGKAELRLDWIDPLEREYNERNTCDWWIKFPYLFTRFGGTERMYRILYQDDNRIVYRLELRDGKWVPGTPTYIKVKEIQ